MRTSLERARYFARGLGCIARARCRRTGPVFISHMLTTRCMARCPTCLWRGDAPEMRSTAAILDFYRRARGAGFVATSFWGGEPLLRADLGEIVRGCRKLGLVVGLVTNGYHLRERAAEIVPHLQHLLVSIDLPSPDHDRLRGVPGLFERALAGIAAARAVRPRLKIIINAVVSRYSYPAVLDVAALAHELGLSVTFEVPDEGRPRFDPEAGEIRCRLSAREERAAFTEIGRRKSAGLPINNSRTYLELVSRARGPAYRCHLPRLCLRLTPDGAAVDCLAPHASLGNVYADPLDEILTGPAAQRLYADCTRCSRCTDSGAIETSFFWELRPEVVGNTLRLFLRR